MINVRKQGVGWVMSHKSLQRSYSEAGALQCWRLMLGANATGRADAMTLNFVGFILNDSLMQ